MLAKYLVRRLLASVVTMVGVSILIFVIARVVPGDPARMALGPQATPEAVEKLRNELFLNEPLWVQYWEYVKGVSHGDLGISLFTNQSVTDDLIRSFPATFELILVSSFLMIFIGIPLGTVAARFRDGFFDNFTRLFSLLGLVTPNFVWSVFLVLARQILSNFRRRLAAFNHGAPACVGTLEAARCRIWLRSCRLIALSFDARGGDGVIWA